MGKKLLRIPLILLLIFSLLSVNMNQIRISKARVDPPDIAVTSVAPSRTLVKAGELVNITVVVQNQGNESETFSVTLYRDTTTIEIKSVAELTAGQNTTLVFAWNTTDTIEEIYALTDKEKTYSIKAVASTLPGETDTEDNTLTSPSNIKVISQYIAVIPERTIDETLTVGKNYTVSIYTDYNGSNVWGWTVLLTFSPAVLECIEVRNGDLVTADTDPSAEFHSTFNNTVGEVIAGADFYYTTLPPFTTSGPGTLVYVTFKVGGTGYSNITLGSYTKLLVYDPVINPVDPIVEIINYYGQPSANHLRSGYFGNTIVKIIDIAVISVKPASTLVTKGKLVNITVVVENKGELDQTFDVKVYYSYTSGFPGQNVIDTKTVNSLAAGANKTLIFTWSTTSVKEGNHIITAIVSGVQGDANPDNDRLDSNEIVTVKLEELRPLPITELIIGVVVIIAIIAAIYFVQRKRRKKTPVE